MDPGNIRNQVGWVFRITTADPANPLFTIPMMAKGTDTPELWMAKFAAHVRV